MSTKKRIWNKEELTIAYYIAKWDMNGLNLHKQTIVDGVIGNTTQPSLNMQVANFRYLLGIEGYQLEDASQAMKDLVDELANSTCTQVRKEVLEYIEDKMDSIETAEINKINKDAKIKAKALNEQEEVNFNNLLKAKKKHGMNLRYVGKRK